ncbi:alpha-L-rhamnosidase [Nocardioides gansuensis]|uniref:Alpha-L-rhamnosidase n=1 Tax=Nocardioides gansuensis TaxID=2138300 RepID=A0A2T8F6X1_9ACTN|nr:glycosyl hydrolase [Nocardioides gansuensis]PVG81455.1 alpha-L-rhamnosidase [Nocardioides gansuensis]
MTAHTPHPQRVSRRAFLGATAAAAGFAVLPSAAARATGPAAAPAIGGILASEWARSFARPGLGTAAGFRWWWPHGLVDPAEVAREVDQVADAGFGVLEVADVTHSLRARGIDIDTESHGWGTPAWVEGVKAALTQAIKRHVRIDLTVGPSWPAAVPTITPDDPAACTELVHGRADVASGTTYDDVLPSPVVHASAGVNRQELVTVQAHRVTARAGSLTTLEPGSYVDLTDSVEGDRLTWTAPADPSGANWVLLACWRRGSGQEPEAGPHTSPRSYVVDHFSAAGARAVVALWEDRVLDHHMRRLLGNAGGYLFEDSLEIETEATIWTPHLLEEFEKRAGYDLRPWLPLVLEVEEDYQFVLGAPGNVAATDALRTNQVRDDFNQVLSDLYLDHHLRPLQDFAHSLGMGLRVQAYGLETDTTHHAAVLDVAETESLGFKNLDDFRVMAGGRDIAGHTILSCEAICYNGAAYNTMWGGNSLSPTSQNQALVTLNSIFAAGVNQAIIHGFPYAEAPEVTWPGFAAFSPYYNGAIGFGEAWGPRTPQWQHVPGIADYLARTQLVLQTGTPKYDIVFLRQKSGASTGIGPFWVTNEGTKLGWSHSFITAPLLTRSDVQFRDGRLAPDGPAYKVLVIGPDKIRSRELTIDLEAARKVLELGRAGLPVVLVQDAGRDWTTQTTPIGRANDQAVAEVRELMRLIAALPTTRTVLEAGVGAAFTELGVSRDVEHADSTVMHVRRTLDGVDLYYLANARHAENRRLNRVAQDVWLTASDPHAVPWLLDAWSGTVTRAPAFERDGARVRVRVDLAPGQSTIVAFADPGQGHRSPSVVPAAGQEIVLHGGRPALRTTTAGTHVVTRSDGSSATVGIDRVRGALTPASWTLTLEDWKPADPSDPTVLGTRREEHTAELAGPTSWSRVAGLEDVSGIGRYSTVVDLGDDWTDEDGALLELGEVNDTFRVRVNGEELPPCDPLDTTVDLGHRLRPGRNVVEIEVASTLLNRLRVVTPAVYGAASRQTYGLSGPVRLVPYVEKTVPR